VIDQVDFEKILWYRVRARDEAKTEGWIEAQHVITSEVLEKSKKLAEEFKDVPPQAAGKLRAASNLRLAFDMSPENILFKLANWFDVRDHGLEVRSEAGSRRCRRRRERVRRSKRSSAVIEEIEAAREAGEP
jgi:hypothetical protein